VSGPDDTLPPSDDTMNLSALPPVNDTDRPPVEHFGVPSAFLELAIPAGEAQRAFAAALDDLQRALNLVEATGMAACRALDAQAEEGL
jgi:hypothetical protein